jgi:ribonuclease VapC
VIVVDASAILAIFLQEEDARLYIDRLANAGPSVISAVNYWEVLVKARLVRGTTGETIVAGLLADLQVKVVSVDSDLAQRGAAAFARFRGRPGGRLNLGDCFAYALAEREGDSLLYKGNDFPRTDVKSALA